MDVGFFAPFILSLYLYPLIAEDHYIGLICSFCMSKIGWKYPFVRLFEARNGYYGFELPYKDDILCHCIHQTAFQTNDLFIVFCLLA